MVLHPWNSKDRSLYWQKSAYLYGQISLNSMTHPFQDKPSWSVNAMRPHGIVKTSHVGYFITEYVHATVDFA